MSRAAPVYMTAEQMGFTKQNFCWLHVFESPAFGLYVVDRGMAVVLADGASHGIRNGVTGWLTGADGAPCLLQTSCCKHTSTHFPKTTSIRSLTGARSDPHVPTKHTLCQSGCARVPCSD